MLLLSRPFTIGRNFCFRGYEGNGSVFLIACLLPRLQYECYDCFSSCCKAVEVEQCWHIPVLTERRYRGSIPTVLRDGLKTWRQ